jgi:hypothetical protein
VDRHACIVAPLDGGPTADIACVSGADHGMGIPHGELYLDAASGHAKDSAVESGLADPSSRGRVLVALDANEDGHIDLYVGTEARNDGLPSINRLLVNDGSAHFTPALRSGVTSSFSVICGESADLEGDGDADLVVCQDPRSASGPGIHLYENLGRGRFVVRAGVRGLRSIGETSVALANLGGDRHLDIVQVGSGRVRISLWAGGRYHPVLDRRLSDAAQVAAGDVDGDGDSDVYVARGGWGADPSDEILIASRGGRSWHARTVPGTAGHGSVPTGVLAADLDHDGRVEFLSLAGRAGWPPLTVAAVR